MITLSNVKTRRDETNSHCTRLTPVVLPEAKSSQTGVSVEYVHDPTKNWYVFRASYGREDKAADFLIEEGTYAYIAKRYVRKYINRRPKKVLETLMPNFVFAYTNKEKAEEYTKNTPELSYLTFYYNHFEWILDFEGKKKNPPLTIPCREMENFIIATCNKDEHLMLVEESQCHFKGGEIVRVTDGSFKGVEGRVARVAGQQRVIVSLTNVGMVSTAYIPKAFLSIIKDRD